MHSTLLLFLAGRLFFTTSGYSLIFSPESSRELIFWLKREQEILTLNTSLYQRVPTLSLLKRFSFFMNNLKFKQYGHHLQLFKWRIPQKTQKTAGVKMQEDNEMHESFSGIQTGKAPLLPTVQFNSSDQTIQSQKRKRRWKDWWHLILRYYSWQKYFGIKVVSSLSVIHSVHSK